MRRINFQPLTNAFIVKHGVEKEEIIYLFKVDGLSHGPKIV